MNCYALLRSRGSDRQRSYAPVILLLPNLKSRHRLTDAWPADCAYLLSVAIRIAYSQTLPREQSGSDLTLGALRVNMRS